MAEWEQGCLRWITVGRWSYALPSPPDFPIFLLQTLELKNLQENEKGTQIGFIIEIQTHKCLCRALGKDRRIYDKKIFARDS